MTVRYPRPFVTIGGVDIPTLEMRVLRSAERSADRFGVTIAASAAIRLGFTLNDFADWQPQDVSVSLSLDLPPKPTRLMVGRVDKPTIHWKDFKITLDGRDKSTLLIDKVRSENFKNQKTKDIVEKIAKDHGLKSHVQSEAFFAGKVYTQDSAYLALGKTDWDIMNDLAAREGCRWYVEGDDLYLDTSKYLTDGDVGRREVVGLTLG